MSRKRRIHCAMHREVDRKVGKIELIFTQSNSNGLSFSKEEAQFFLANKQYLCSDCVSFFLAIIEKPERLEVSDPVAQSVEHPSGYGDDDSSENA